MTQDVLGIDASVSYSLLQFRRPLLQCLKDRVDNAKIGSIRLRPNLSRNDCGGRCMFSNFITTYAVTVHSSCQSSFTKPHNNRNCINHLDTFLTESLPSPAALDYILTNTPVNLLFSPFTIDYLHYIKYISFIPWFS
jgi:hypothetical protein